MPFVATRVKAVSALKGLNKHVTTRDGFWNISVAYPLLRVETKEFEIEGERGLPPGLFDPASIEPFDLEIDRHLSPLGTAKAADLAKLAPQLAIGALQQRGGADEFPCQAIERVVSNGLLEVTGERDHRFGCSCLPGLGKSG